MAQPKLVFVGKRLEDGCPLSDYSTQESALNPALRPGRTPANS